MTGMEFVVQTRRAGLRPHIVVVRLVDELDAPGYLGDGMFTVDVLKTERAQALDFRPLVGLWVVVVDRTGDNAKHRDLTRAVSEAKPSKLQMPVRSEAGFRVHTRENGNTWTVDVTGAEAAALERV